MTCLAETLQQPEWAALIVGPAAAVIVLAIANWWQATQGLKVVEKYDKIISEKDKDIKDISREAVTCITNISNITAAQSVALKEMASGIAQIVKNTEPKHP